MEGVPAKKLVPVTLMQATLCRHALNDPISARGVFLILGVQAGAFNRKEAFILVTVTSSTKLIGFRRKY